MKEVIGISLGPAAQDFSFETRWLGTPLRVRRLGTDGSAARAARLLRQWDRKATAIGLGLTDAARPAGRKVRTRSAPPDAAALCALARHARVTRGEELADLFMEWAVRHTQQTLGSYFNNARVLVLSGQQHFKVAATLAEFTPNLQFADALLQLGVPKMLSSLDGLQRYLAGAHYVTDWTPPALMQSGPLQDWTRFVLRRALAKAHVLVAPVHALDDFGLEELAGKTVVTAGVSEARLAALRDKGVHLVVDAAPEIAGHAVGPALLEAMLLAATGETDPHALGADAVLAAIEREALTPRLLYPNGFRRVNRFAFVIHPLSQEYFKKVKPIEVLSRVAPPVAMDTLEKIMAYAPPFVYSRVTGIRSPTGVEAEGWLISVGGTPREIMSHPPEFTYRRLLDAAELARRLGAQIMGLGAFTKVVGDAGATVARRASLPITTGNSYSASGALWAAHDALLRLNLLPKPRGKGRVDFKAMVVGATGSIGSVCARLLAKVAQEVVLVAPEPAKLLALKASILAETPDARLRVAAQADRLLGEMDMIVTATSGAGKKVLDIMKVKPGCVITDVARPLDLPPEEVAKRPDVLVIESGEIELPGDVQMKNIGLPKNVAYACVAETVVLCLEHRFEPFTVGRAIEWEKVREIYKLGLKHGMKLAAISGVNGPYSDADIERVRELALARRAERAAKPARTPRRRRTASAPDAPAAAPAPAPSRRLASPAAPPTTTPKASRATPKKAPRPASARTRRANGG
ncbi:dehydrogenase [Tibeticola sp.]|uniref:dehydrogenase n=1 Tax=Tibeticola sp. TaxID=2005368 RepID=UPI0025DDA1D4|nr:dehydrogenase [Tibeticola sp.]